VRRLASLRMLLALHVCVGCEDCSGLADRADEAEMIQPLAVQPHSHRGRCRADSALFSPVGRFVPCNSLDERSLPRLGEHAFAGIGFASSVRSSTIAARPPRRPGAQIGSEWGEGEDSRGSAQLPLRVDLPHPVDLRPGTFSRREKGRVVTQTSDRRLRQEM
jgi:hypothetical protein